MKLSLGLFSTLPGALSAMNSANASGATYLPKIPLHLEGPALKVKIMGPGNSMRWILGVKRDDNKSPHVVLGAGDLAAAGNSSTIRLLSNFRQLEMKAFTISAGSLAVDLNQQNMDGLVASVVVPSTTLVQVSRDNEAVADAPSNASLLILDGRVLDEPVKGFGPVVLRLQMPPESVQPPIRRLPNGLIVVSKENLKAHLTGNVPAIWPAAGPKNTSARLVVDIGVDGNIHNIVQTVGDATVARFASSLVRDWKFSPFEFEGRRVAVRSVIVFPTDANGTVRVLW